MIQQSGSFIFNPKRWKHIDQKPSFRNFIHTCQNLEANRYSSVDSWINRLWFTQSWEDTLVGKKKLPTKKL